MKKDVPSLNIISQGLAFRVFKSLLIEADFVGTAVLAHGDRVWIKRIRKEQESQASPIPKIFTAYVGLLFPKMTGSLRWSMWSLLAVFGDNTQSHGSSILRGMHGWGDVRDVYSGHRNSKPEAWLNLKL